MHTMAEEKIDNALGEGKERKGNDGKQEIENALGIRILQVGINK
ncbi:hypothetical protein [uncultured Butyricimonas sp.]|nr:hypothetical protein [uncultured Butyricimonas sp.]